MGADMGRSIEGLTPVERLIHYRLFAEQALEEAISANNEELKSRLLARANAWHVLATELERQIRGSMPPAPSNDSSANDLDQSAG